jgi:Domain of unknown function DUF11
MSNLPRRLSAGLLLSCALGTTILLPAAPALAAEKTTLVVTVAATGAPPLPGKTATYTISIHNTGPVSAASVQLEMTTDTPIDGVSARVSSGRCYRSSLETACIFGTVKAGATATATVSGTLPKDATLHSNVSVTASVTSPTQLTAPAWSMLVYKLGGPVPQAARPSPPPAPSATEPVVVQQDTEGAAQWLQPTGFTRTLAIGFAVFVIGLVLAGRFWESRRRPALAASALPALVGAADTAELAGTADTAELVGTADTTDEADAAGWVGAPDEADAADHVGAADRTEPVPSQAAPEWPEAADAVDVTRDQ